MTRETSTQAFTAVADIDVETDTLLDVLGHRRRRFVLACLEEYAPPLALSDVADEVAVLERDVSSLNEIPAHEVKLTYVSLYHVHVPKMADAGLVEYDQETDAIAPAELTDRLAETVPLPAVETR